MVRALPKYIKKSDTDRMKTNIIMHKCLEVGPTAVASWLIDNFPSVDPRRPLLQSAPSHHSQCDLRYLQHLLN